MKKTLLSLAILTMLAPAAFADGAFHLHGAYWNTDEADDTFGAGITYNAPLGQVLGLELRASYFEEVKNEPFEELFDGENPFDSGLEILPLEAGLRFELGQGGVFRPYLSGGASYYLLDSEFGDVDDEFGFYAAFGGIIGDHQGAHFFFEAIYRQVEGSVEVDPNDLDDIDDIDFEDSFDVDLSGLGANAGVAWTW